MNISFLAYGSNVSYDTIARVFLPTVPFPTIARVFLPTVPTFPTIARVDKFSCLRTVPTLALDGLAYRTVPTFPTIALARVSGLRFQRFLATIGRVLAAASCMHTTLLHTRTDKSSRTWAYAYG